VFPTFSFCCTHSIISIVNCILLKVCTRTSEIVIQTFYFVCELPVIIMENYVIKLHFKSFGGFGCFLCSSFGTKEYTRIYISYVRF